ARARQAEFAQHYLEKLLNVEVPVPRAEAKDLRRVLDGAERRTERRRAAYHLKRQLRHVVSAGAAAAAGLVVAAALWQWMGTLAAHDATESVAVALRPPAAVPRDSAPNAAPNAAPNGAPNAAPNAAPN